MIPAVCLSAFDAVLPLEGQSRLSNLLLRLSTPSCTRRNMQPRCAVAITAAVLAVATLLLLLTANYSGNPLQTVEEPTGVYIILEASAFDPCVQSTER